MPQFVPNPYQLAVNDMRASRTSGSRMSAITRCAVDTKLLAASNFIHLLHRAGCTVDPSLIALDKPKLRKEHRHAVAIISVCPSTSRRSMRAHRSSSLFDYAANPNSKPHKLNTTHRHGILLHKRSRHHGSCRPARLLHRHAPHAYRQEDRHPSDIR